MPSVKIKQDIEMSKVESQMPNYDYFFNESIESSNAEPSATIITSLFPLNWSQN
jgi:hypothetical protein